MTAPATTAIRWAVLLGGFVASVVLAVAWFQHRAGASDGTAVIVDNTAEIRELLERRVLEAPTAVPPSTRAVAESFARANGLVREVVDEETAATFFPTLRQHRNIYDPLVWFARRPDTALRFAFPEHPSGEWIIRTNAHGFRDVTPVAATRPALRILVAGDSQLEGVCANEEMISERIEYRLQLRRPAESVEVLNGAIGGHTPYNYLGTLEKYVDLEPDLFVVFVFGGNDFKGMMPIRRYFHHAPAPRGVPHRHSVLVQATDRIGGLAYAEFGQLYYFLNNPEDRDVAVTTLDRITRTIRDVCHDRGIGLLFVYIPPPLSGNPGGYRDERAGALEAAGLSESDLGVTDTIADAWLAKAAEAEVDVLDLRPVFVSCEERLFWSDAHLNLRGGEVVGTRVANALEVLLKK